MPVSVLGNYFWIKLLSIQGWSGAQIYNDDDDNKFGNNGDDNNQEDDADDDNFDNENGDNNEDDAHTICMWVLTCDDDDGNLRWR